MQSDVSAGQFAQNYSDLMKENYQLTHPLSLPGSKTEYIV
jgi:hypothetical protein